MLFINNQSNQLKCSFADCFALREVGLTTKKLLEGKKNLDNLDNITSIYQLFLAAGVRNRKRLPGYLTNT